MITILEFLFKKFIAIAIYIVSNRSSFNKMKDLIKKVLKKGASIGSSSKSFEIFYHLLSLSFTLPFLVYLENNFRQKLRRLYASQKLLIYQERNRGLVCLMLLIAPLQTFLLYCLY